MISCQRHLFNIPENISYFNCAYLSPQLNESKKALIEGVNLKSIPWEWTSEKFFSGNGIRMGNPAAIASITGIGKLSTFVL